MKNVQKYHRIPSINRMITAGHLVSLVKKCKASPGQAVEKTISNWWGGTTDDVVKEFTLYIHDAINMRR